MKVSSTDYLSRGEIMLVIHTANHETLDPDAIPNVSVSLK